jgi:chorismate synthase
MTLRYLTAGESHGPALVAIAEGFPAGLAIDFDEVNRDLRRRQKGYGRGGRQKIEKDEAEFLAGLRGGVTLGAPIALVVWNKDHESWKDLVSPYARGGRPFTRCAPATRTSPARSSTPSPTRATCWSARARAPPRPRSRSGRSRSSSSRVSA